MRIVYVFLLLSCLAVAQTATPPPGHPAAPRSTAPHAPTTPGPDVPSKPATTVPPSAVVITIDGFCAKPDTTPATECKTQITRADFEKLANALNPQMPDPTKRQLANAYAQMLVADKVAEDRGLDKKPDTMEVLRFTRMQALASLLVRSFQEEASKVPQAEIEKYYNEHKNQYEEGSFQRIFITKAPSEPGKSMDEAKLKAEAEKIQAAAAAGGDFEKLQKQAYDELGVKSPPPSVAINNVRRAAIPPNQAQVFDLTPGKVSPVMDEPGGLYVYKLVSKHSLPLPDVEQEIKRTLEGERMQKAVDSIRKTPELNEAYFGPATEGQRPLPPGAQGPPGTPRSSSPPMPSMKKQPAQPPKPTPKMPPNHD